MKAIKILIAAAFLLLFYFLVDFEELKSSLSETDIVAFSMAVGVIFVIRLLMSLRWKILLGSRSIPLSMAESVYINLVSHSVGFLFPGGVGADIMRGHHAYQKSKDVMSIANTLLFDRVLGVISMIVVALSACTVVLLQGMQVPEVVSWVFTACLLLLLAIPAGYVCLLKLKASLFAFSPSGGRMEWLLNKVYALLEIKQITPKLLGGIMTVSLVMQLLRAVLFCFLFQSLALDVGFVYVLAFTPIVFMVMLIPVTIGGLGLREGAIYALFFSVGVGLEQSVAVGLLFYAAQVLMVVPGLLMFLAGSVFRSKKLT